MEAAGLAFFLRDHPGEFGHNGAARRFQALFSNECGSAAQGVAIYANSDNGIMIANELRSHVPRILHGRFPRERGPIGELVRSRRSKGRPGPEEIRRDEKASVIRKSVQRNLF